MTSTTHVGHTAIDDAAAIIRFVLHADPRRPRERIVDYLPAGFPVGIDVVPRDRG